ncbi:MAG TPA: carboxymuconolactone decarboxylase family protein, partial [Reyranella sp.]
MSNVRIAYDSFQKTAPAARDALLAMGKAADESGVEKEIVELVKLRVSQINNCAFCL